MWMRAGMVSNCWTHSSSDCWTCTTAVEQLCWLHQFYYCCFSFGCYTRARQMYGCGEKKKRKILTSPSPYLLSPSGLFTFWDRAQALSVYIEKVLLLWWCCVWALALLPPSRGIVPSAKWVLSEYRFAWAGSYFLLMGWKTAQAFSSIAVSFRELFFLQFQLTFWTKCTMLAWCS